VIIKKRLREVTYHELPLEMVDDVSVVRKKHGLSSDGKELGLFKRSGDKYRIYVTRGLTHRLAYETLSHEWAHAFFAEHGHPRHSQEIEEGFCQWVASHVLREKKYERELKILQFRTDMYGTGFRAIKAIEDRSGEKGVFSFIAKPPGG